MGPALAPLSPAESAPAAVPDIAEHVGICPDHCVGRPHILGHRVEVKHVATRHEEAGMSPAEGADSYPTIGLAARKDHDA